MVDTNESNMPSMEEFLAGGGSKSLSFKEFKIGDSYTGVITGARLVDVRNYEDPTKIETWDDGKPKRQIEVTLDTDYADPDSDDDTGERRVFLFGQKLTALKEELKRLGLTKLENGMTFKITLTGTKPAKNPRYNDVKLYGITLSPAKSNPDVDALLADAGATPIEKKSAKVEGLTAKQKTIAETLRTNGFPDEDIAEQLGVSVDVVKDALDLI